MKLRLPIAFVLIINLFPLFSQAQESNKLDLYTRRMIHSKGFNRTDINLFVRGNQSAIANAAERAAGYLKYSYGDISAVRIPLKNIDKFLNDPNVIAVENADIPMHRMCDSAMVTNNVLPVQDGTAPAGQNPLPQPYKGDGVIVGIIDEGIDIHHADFKKANGQTRIRYLWDQNAANSNAPAPYAYGQEWSELDINAGNCNFEEPVNAFSHGTHVTGIAAGNGLASNAFTGMAPHADIIEVSMNEATSFLSHFVDACDYIYKKADAMGKPCVINASVGTYRGSHDGQDMAAQMIDAMLEQRRGRSLVCALGNAGQIKMHLGYQVTSDTSFTWFKINQSANDVFYEMYADSADFNNVMWSVGADDPSTNTFIGSIGFHDLKTTYGLTGNDQLVDKNFVLYNGTTFIATCSTEVTVLKGVYKLAVYINQPQNGNYLWRFSTTGSGRFDIWSVQKQLNFSDMVATLPDTTLNPTYRHYMLPDTLKTLVSSFTCSDKVISVGNFVNRASIIDYARDTIRYNLTPGEIFKDSNPDTTVRLGSSYGPTRDNRLKPDISAPGGIVVASGNARFISDALGSGNPANTEKIAWTGKHFRNSGTSMASPMVAGAVALYLQRFPNANYREIKEAFTSTARKDSFTTNTPNVAYGYGKLDCFAAMQTNIKYGCTDTGSINYDVTANHNDGSCVAKVYGCMDVDADNYNAQANIADSCTYTVIGIGNTKRIDPTVSASPNPSTGTATIYYYIAPEMVGNTHLLVTDLLGKTISDINLPQTQGAINYHITAKGVYIYYLNDGNKVYSKKKLVVY